VRLQDKVTLNGESAKGLSTSEGRTSFEPVTVYKQRFQMKENTLKKLELLLLNRRREMMRTHQ